MLPTNEGFRCKVVPNVTRSSMLNKGRGTTSEGAFPASAGIVKDDDEVASYAIAFVESLVHLPRRCTRWRSLDNIPEMNILEDIIYHYGFIGCMRIVKHGGVASCGTGYAAPRRCLAFEGMTVSFLVEELNEVQG